MPEIIDLVVARENMLRRIRGKRLIHVQVFNPKIIKNTTPEDFTRIFVGSTLDDIERKSKILRFCFGENSFVVHLMLYGDYWWARSVTKRSYTVIELIWEDSESLLIKDRSTWVKMEVHAPEYSLYSEMLGCRYGPDALSDKINSKMLTEILSSHSRIGIKKTITDQTLISGLGNAYADEILWDAMINPADTCVQVLNSDKVIILAESIHKILTESLREVRRLACHQAINEQPREFMHIYRKSGQACPRCGYMISCRKLNGRETFICEKCQR